MCIPHSLHFSKNCGIPNRNIKRTVRLCGLFHFEVAASDAPVTERSVSAELLQPFCQLSASDYNVTIIKLQVLV
jgi:hypothetical protein